MRAVIQRVTKAEVLIDQKVHSRIERGLVILLGIDELDLDQDLNYLVTKILNMRIFNDSSGKMNLSLDDINAEILVVSQFTLFASTKKGNRPCYFRSANPNKAKMLYDQFILECSKLIPGKVRSGVFAANMHLQIINDGPVTIMIDSKNKNL